METLLHIMELGGRMLLLSGAMLLAYAMFLRRRAGYRLCRRLLLSVPFLCLAVPALHFAGGRLAEARGPREVTVTRAQAGEYIGQMPEGAAVPADGVVLTEQVLPADGQTDYDRLGRTAAWGIAAVAALLLLLMAGQLLVLAARCRRMVRRGTATDDGIVRCREIDTPFSFGRRIFLPAERLTADGERMVVAHERAHILLGHSAEGLLMEAFCRLLWFNPFVWMARRELRNVQEFEADRQVLDAGTEILPYQTLLLEETMKECPALADGFNRSFVRRRFIEMKSPGRRRSSSSLRFAVAAMAVCMTGLASAGVGRERVILKIADEDAPAVAETAAAVPDTPAAKAPKLQPTPDTAVLETADEESSEADDRTATPEDDRPTRAQDGWPILYSLPLADDHATKRVYMRHTADETHLTFCQTVRSDDELFKFGGPECYIVDRDSGIHYQARRTVPAGAWDHFHLRGMKGKRIAVTVVFPRLPADVREIALYRVTGHLQSDSRYRVKDILVK